MSRFQPTQGPGIGFHPATIQGRVTNFGIERLKGTTARHITGTTGPPYAFLFATLPEEAPTNLIGIVQDTVIGDVEVDIVVQGQVLALCSNMLDEGVPDGTWAVGDFLSATLLGDLRPALPGEPVYARALEPGVPGELALVDFNGDPHFGILP